MRDIPGLRFSGILVALSFCLLARADDSWGQTTGAQPLVNRSGDIGEFLSLGDFDKCGVPDEKELEAERAILGNGWGYGYDQLLTDIEGWKQSPYVSVQSIGKTVQGRDLWELTINSGQPVPNARSTITIHARTHPHETQSWWVCEQIIRILLSEDPLANTLRRYCTFHIIPMYNPDGVELETTRYNANGVDLEREWDKPNPQPEAAALKRRFDGLMHSGAPIRVALNLHSSSDLQRYFWFHDPSGTSEEYAGIERGFIAQVRSWFGQISPWDYRVSWINETPTHFPESWFWLNYGTDVLALTYEDIFSHSLTSPDAHFDSAAFGILNGITDYLGLRTSGVRANATEGRLDVSVFPGTSTRFELTLPVSSHVNVSVFNALGSRIAVLVNGPMNDGTHVLRWEPGSIPSGSYFVRVSTPGGTTVKPFALVH